MAYRIFCDFDGTIASRDVTDMLLEAFAAPAWREIEAQWQAGLIGSADCMARQVGLLSASRPALDRLIDTVEIDPGFSGFVAFCRDHDIELTVVSDGLDHAIARILARAGFGDLPVIANRLLFLPQDRHAMLSPHAWPGCRSAAGTCKCRVAGAGSEKDRRTTILIGDGRSDYCVAGIVDLVFAKAGLLDHCRVNGITHLPYRDFAEITQLLAERLAGLETVELTADDAFFGREQPAASHRSGLPGPVLP